MKEILILVLLGSILTFRPEVCAQENGQRGVATVATPEEENPKQPGEDFDRSAVLPEAHMPGAPGQLSATASVWVNDIRLINNRVLSEALIKETTNAYLHRQVSIEELHELRQKLSVLFFDQGFVNTGVLLPDQKIKGGIIAFQVVKGEITTVKLQGNYYLNDSYWHRQFESISEGFLQINELQSTLKLIEQHALVQRVEAQLQPGLNPGESTLSVKVTENSAWIFTVGVDNYRSPSLGGEQLTFYAAHQSLTHRGDMLEVYANLGDGLGDAGASYTLPLGFRGGSVQVYLSGGDAEIVEYPFNQLDIESKTHTAGLKFAIPFVRRLEESWTGLLGVEALHSESTLLGIPFSFSLGEIEGESDSTAFIAGFEWTRRSQERVFALQMTLRRGMEWGDAAVNEYVPDGLNGPHINFLSLRGQIQYVKRLNWKSSELHFRSSFQLASDPLLPVEKMPVGGAYSVRGYRENLLVRDNGIVASAEWRLPLFRDHVAVGNFDPRMLSLVLFSDFGQSWDEHTGLPSDKKARIYSVGAGLIWMPLPGLQAQIYRGEALKDITGTGNDLQDDGWHARVSYQFF